MLGFRRTFWALGFGAAVVGMLVPAPVSLAQSAVSANDNKVVLVNGMSTVVQNPAPDTAAIIARKEFPSQIIAKIEVPASVVGAPLSVAITHDKTGVSHVTISPDGKTALATRQGDSLVSVLAIDGPKVEHTKRDLTVGMRPYGAAINADGTVAVVANIGRGTGDNDTVSVIDMTLRPIRTIETITVGQTPEGLNLSSDGKLCAVIIMNGSNKPRDSPFSPDYGKVLVSLVQQNQLTKLAEAPIGHWSQGVAFTPDNQYVLM